VNRNAWRKAQWTGQGKARQGKAVISIIVPIYNTETYLKRSVDSLLGQSYQDIEVWLVDDGSTDRSADICDEYAVLDNRVHVLHKANGGEASARNAGLARANGDYVMFCDSDDEYLPDAVADLARAMTQNDVDLVVGAYLEKTGDVTRCASTNQQRHTTPGIALRMLLTDPNPYGAMYIMSTVNGSLFKRSILREHNITFDESFAVGSDSLFVCDYLRHCAGVFDILKAVYVYYKFEPAERIQGMAWLYPDNYLHTIAVTERLLSVAAISDSDRRTILARLFDGLVSQLVIATAYEEYFLNGMYGELKRLVSLPLLRKAVASYRRTRITDSRLIPLFFRLKAVWLLLAVLKSKARRYISRRGKSENVRRMVRQ
jgi:glycosyltransferase involved in cell wall biosynthesis